MPVDDMDSLRAMTTNIIKEAHDESRRMRGSTRSSALSFLFDEMVGAPAVSPAPIPSPVKS